MSRSKKSNKPPAKDKAPDQTGTETVAPAAGAGESDGSGVSFDEASALARETGLLPDPPADNADASPVDERREGESYDLSSGDLDPPDDELFELAEPKMEPPTFEEVTGEGFSDQAAKKIVDSFTATANIVNAETSKRDAIAKGDRPHYIVSCPMKRGYWKIGRHFTMEEITLFADELTAVERHELDIAHPLHLTVEKVGFKADTSDEV